MCKYNKIIIITIINVTFLSFYYLNNNNLIEGADFETATISTSINNILSSNTFSNINIPSGGELKIGETSLTEDNIKMLNGLMPFYIYKKNHGNDYLRFDNGNTVFGHSSDTDDFKKVNGSLYMSNKT